MASDKQQDDFLGLVLPDAGVVELTDCLTEYMTCLLYTSDAADE